MREQLEPRRRKLSAEAAARDRFGHTYLYAPAGTPLGDQMARLTERSRGMDGAALSRVQERAEPEAQRCVPPLLLTPYVAVPLGGSRAPPSPHLPPIAGNRAASCVVRLPPLRLPLPPGPSPDPRAPPPHLGPYDWPVPSRETKVFEAALQGGGWRRGEGRGPGR